MQDIEIKVNNETREVTLEKKFLGINSENLQGKLIFTFVDFFVDGIAWLETEMQGTTSYIPLTKNGETYELDILSSLLTSGKIKMQLRVTEAQKEEGIPIFKSKIFTMRVSDAINANIEQPRKYPLWIDIANAKMVEIENAISNVEKIDISQEQTETGVKITIVGKDGTVSTTNILNGAKGDKGDKGDKGEQGLPGASYDDTEIRGLIPTKTSDLTNDNNYQSLQQVNTLISAAIGTALEGGY